MQDDVRTSLNMTEDGGDPAMRVSLASLPERSPVAIDAQIDGQAEALIVYRDGGAVRAWLNVCPHAGRRLDWAPGRFLQGKDGSLICAAHGASFELGRGDCIAGPCRGQSLRAVAARVDGDEVVLG